MGGTFAVTEDAFATIASLTAEDCLDGTITPTVAVPMDLSLCTVGERSEEMVWTDNAGLFGASYTSNSVTFTRTVTVTDTIDPVLIIDDASKLVTTVQCDTVVPTTTTDTEAAHATLEACSCASRQTFYYSSNADCKISYAMGDITKSSGATTNHQATFEVDVTAKGYLTSSDTSRAFTIVDTAPPTIDIDGTITTNWDLHKNGNIGTTCAALTAESTTFSTYTNFDVGTYVFKYTCTDEANLSVSACRTVINQDHTLPVITIDTPIER